VRLSEGEESQIKSNTAMTSKSVVQSQVRLVWTGRTDEECCEGEGGGRSVVVLESCCDFQISKSHVE